MGGFGMNVPDYLQPDYVRQANANAAKKATEQGTLSDANASIASGTAAGTYHAPMTAEQLAQSDLANRQQAFTESQALARQQALAAIAAQIQTSTGYSPGGTAPAPAPTSPADLASENAGYGRAKERTGLAMQSALKGLRGAMASRGISGSGIEATGTASVYGGGVGDLAETDRQMAEQGAGRAFTANQSALDRAEQARQANMQNQSQRLSQLISLYGSAY